MPLAGAFHGITTLEISKDPVLPFLGLYLVASLAWVGICLHVRRHPPRAPRATWALLGAGLALRLVAWNAPYLLETDLHRYLWDGYVLSQGFNPYQFSPSEVRAARHPGGNAHLSERDRDLARALYLRARAPAIRGYFARVNYPDLPTCYPPLAELAFGAVAWVAPGSPRAWKLLVVALDMGVCLVILAMLRALGRPPAWVVFYAWCPLVLKEYANTGHFDPLATLCACLGVLALLWERPGWAGLALGAGVAAKLYPLVLVVLFWRRLGPRGLAAAALVPLLLVAPFLGIGAEVLEGLGAFAARWEFNSSLFTLLWGLLGFSRDPWWTLEVAGHTASLTGFHVAKLLAGLIYLGLLAALLRWREQAPWSLPARAGLALGGLFLLAPVADPWYLPWALPFLVLFPRPSVMFLSVSVAAYYLYFLGWRDVWWYRVLEYGPFFLLLGRDLAAAAGSRDERLPEPLDPQPTTSA